MDRNRRKIAATVAWTVFSAALVWLTGRVVIGSLAAQQVSGIEVTQNDTEVRIRTSAIEAVIHKQGYVSGVSAGTFLDKKTGFHDLGHGLDIVDWLLEPGSSETSQAQLNPQLVYRFHDLVHGDIPKTSIEGPQICTTAKKVPVDIITGKDFVAVKEHFKYYLAAPGKKPGSEWTQTLLFLDGKRYFISADRIDTVNSSKALCLRIDMPGHIRHHQGDNFSEVYLSYYGRIPSSEFLTDFPPDKKFLYDRTTSKIPKHFIRAYHIRNPQTGAEGPWLAGITLNPAVVFQGWCHERGYVCMIEEIGGRPVKAGGSFGAAYVVGFFDSIDEMDKVAAQYAGAVGLEVSSQGWKLLKTLR
jgi:hypothetical protein